MHQVGGKEWEDWYGKLVHYFVTSGSQHADGSWSTTNRREVGPVERLAQRGDGVIVPAELVQHDAEILPRLGVAGRTLERLAEQRRRLGRPAEPGDEVTHDGVVFHVDSVEGQRIERLTVTFASRQAAAADGGDPPG